MNCNLGVMKYIKLFQEISKDDANTAGGKGASLGEMTQAGIPVPPGFVVLAGAFDAFLAETDMGVEIAAVLNTVKTDEMHTVEHASEKIQALILSATMPSDIANEVTEAYNTLCHCEESATKQSRILSEELPRSPSLPRNGSNFFVAVRSSATAEDGATAAWAGQLDSFLNTTKDTLLQNIQKCWASLFTPRAIFYGFEKGYYTSPSVIPAKSSRAGIQDSEQSGSRISAKPDSGMTNPISVAVVIQTMVQSEISGIAFSVHPVTEDRNQLIIEAGFGLGEAIVSGQITPDSYVVTKQPLEIIDKNIVPQDRMLVRAQSGGNEWVSIPSVIPDNRGSASAIRDPELARLDYGSQAGMTAQKLSDIQILELSKLIIKIENHYGFPCDIEWAFISSPVIPDATSQSAGAGDPESSHGQFFITQSRPITTLSVDQNILTFEPVSYRDWSVVYCQLAHGMWTIAFKKEFGWSVTDICYDWDGNKVTLYRPREEHVQGMFDFVSNLIDLDGEIINHIAGQLLGLTAELQKFVTTSTSIVPGAQLVELQDIMRELINFQNRIAPKFFIIMYLPQLLESFPEHADTYAVQARVAIETRSQVDKVFAPLSNKLSIELCERALQLARLPLELGRFLSLSEFKGIINHPSAKPSAGLQTALSARQKHFLVAGGEVFTIPIAQYIELHHWVLSMPKITSEDVIQGSSPYKGGIVQGRVRVVQNVRDAREITPGDIVVAPMTTPEYVPYLKDVVAIITEEGGVTSHAAILSREMHIPTVVGTKIATQVLHDGDLVEVDADSGVVRVLERAEK